MATVEAFKEAALFSLLFLTVLTVVVVNFNALYGENYDPGFSDPSNSEQLFITYQENARQQIEGGEVQFDANTGISLKSSWGISKDIVTIIWNFISGGWIEQLTNAWGLGASGVAVAKFFRILYFIALIFALLYMLFKVVL